MRQRIAGGSERVSWRSAGDAWNLLSEFISAIGVWGAIGYGLDRWFGTWPILFVIGTLVGYVAGVWILLWRTKQTGGAALRRMRAGSPK
ncbi:MAG: AtpZ/AtpI family protein [Actinomycetota bacterium]